MGQPSKTDYIQDLTGPSTHQRVISWHVVSVGDASLDVVVRIAVPHRVLEGISHRLKRLFGRSERVLVRREVC